MPASRFEATLSGHDQGGETTSLMRTNKARAQAAQFLLQDSDNAAPLLPLDPSQRISLHRQLRSRYNPSQIPFSSLQCARYITASDVGRLAKIFNQFDLFAEVAAAPEPAVPARTRQTAPGLGASGVLKQSFPVATGGATTSVGTGGGATAGAKTKTAVTAAAAATTAARGASGKAPVDARTAKAAAASSAGPSSTAPPNPRRRLSAAASGMQPSAFRSSATPPVPPLSSWRRGEGFFHGNGMTLLRDVAEPPPPRVVVPASSPLLFSTRSGPLGSPRPKEKAAASTTLSPTAAGGTKAASALSPPALSQGANAGPSTSLAAGPVILTTSAGVGGLSAVTSAAGTSAAGAVPTADGRDLAEPFTSESGDCALTMEWLVEVLLEMMLANYDARNRRHGSGKSGGVGGAEEDEGEGPERKRATVALASTVSSNGHSSGNGGAAGRRLSSAQTRSSDYGNVSGATGLNLTTTTTTTAPGHVFSTTATFKGRPRDTRLEFLQSAKAELVEWADHLQQACDQREHLLAWQHCALQAEVLARYQLCVLHHVGRTAQQVATNSRHASPLNHASETTPLRLGKAATYSPELGPYALENKNNASITPTNSNNYTAGGGGAGALEASVPASPLRPRRANVSWRMPDSLAATARQATDTHPNATGSLNPTTTTTPTTSNATLRFGAETRPVGSASLRSISGAAFATSPQSPAKGGGAVSSTPQGIFAGSAARPPRDGAALVEVLSGPHQSSEHPAGGDLAPLLGCSSTESFTSDPLAALVVGADGPGLLSAATVMTEGNYLAAKARRVAPALGDLVQRPLELNDFLWESAAAADIAMAEELRVQQQQHARSARSGQSTTALLSSELASVTLGEASRTLTNAEGPARRPPPPGLSASVSASSPHPPGVSLSGSMAASASQQQSSYKRRRAAAVQHLVCWSDVASNLLMGLETTWTTQQHDLAYVRVPTALLEDVADGARSLHGGYGGLRDAAASAAGGVGATAGSLSAAGLTARRLSMSAVTAAATAAAAANGAALLAPGQLPPADFDDDDDDDDAEESAALSLGAAGMGGQRRRRRLHKSGGGTDAVSLQQRAMLLSSLGAAAEAAVRTLHAQAADHVIVSPSQKYLVTSSKDGMLKVWETSRGQFVETILNVEQAWVLHMCFLHGGEYLLVATSAAEITVVNFPSGGVVVKLRGCTSVATAIAFVKQPSTVYTQRYGLRPGECGLHKPVPKQGTSVAEYHAAAAVRLEKQVEAESVPIAARPLIGYVAPTSAFYEEELGHFFFGTLSGMVGCVDLSEPLSRSGLLAAAAGARWKGPLHVYSSVHAHPDHGSPVRPHGVSSPTQSSLPGYSNTSGAANVQSLTTLSNTAATSAGRRVNGIFYCGVGHCVVSADSAGGLVRTSFTAAADTLAYALGSPVVVMETEKPIRLMTCCPGGRRFVTVHSDRRALLWSVGRTTTEVIHQYPQEAYDIVDACFLPHLQQVALLMADRSVHVFDERGTRPVSTIQPPRGFSSRVEDIASVTLKYSANDGEGCLAYVPEARRIVCGLRGPVLYEPVTKAAPGQEVNTPAGGGTGEEARSRRGSGLPGAMTRDSNLNNNNNNNISYSMGFKVGRGEGAGASRRASAVSGASFAFLQLASAPPSPSTSPHAIVHGGSPARGLPGLDATAVGAAAGTGLTAADRRPARERTASVSSLASDASEVDERAYERTRRRLRQQHFAAALLKAQHRLLPCQTHTSAVVGILLNTERSELHTISTDTWVVWNYETGVRVRAPVVVPAAAERELALRPRACRVTSCAWSSHGQTRLLLGTRGSRVLTLDAGAGTVVSVTDPLTAATAVNPPGTAATGTLGRAAVDAVGGGGYVSSTAAPKSSLGSGSAAGAAPHREAEARTLDDKDVSVIACCGTRTLICRGRVCEVRRYEQTGTPLPSGEEKFVSMQVQLPAFGATGAAAAVESSTVHHHHDKASKVKGAKGKRDFGGCTAGVDGGTGKAAHLHSPLNGGLEALLSCASTATATITACCVVRESYLCVGTSDTQLFFYRMVDHSSPIQIEVLRDASGEPDVGRVISLHYIHNKTQDMLLAVVDTGVLYVYSYTLQRMIARYTFPCLGANAMSCAGGTTTTTRRGVSSPRAPTQPHYLTCATLTDDATTGATSPLASAGAAAATAASSNTAGAGAAVAQRHLTLCCGDSAGFVHVASLAALFADATAAAATSSTKVAMKTRELRMSASFRAAASGVSAIAALRWARLNASTSGNDEAPMGGRRTTTAPTFLPPPTYATTSAAAGSAVGTGDAASTSTLIIFAGSFDGNVRVFCLVSTLLSASRSSSHLSATLATTAGAAALGGTAVTMLSSTSTRNASPFSFTAAPGANGLGPRSSSGSVASPLRIGSLEMQPILRSPRAYSDHSSGQAFTPTRSEDGRNAFCATNFNTYTNNSASMMTNNNNNNNNNSNQSVPFSTALLLPSSTPQRTTTLPHAAAASATAGSPVGLLGMGGSPRRSGGSTSHAWPGGISSRYLPLTVGLCGVDTWDLCEMETFTDVKQASWLADFVAEGDDDAEGERQRSAEAEEGREEGVLGGGGEPRQLTSAPTPPLKWHLPSILDEDTDAERGEGGGSREKDRLAGSAVVVDAASSTRDGGAVLLRDVLQRSKKRLSLHGAALTAGAAAAAAAAAAGGAVGGGHGVNSTTAHATGGGVEGLRRNSPGASRGTSPRGVHALSPGEKAFASTNPVGMAKAAREVNAGPSTQTERPTRIHSAPPLHTHAGTTLPSSSSAAGSAAPPLLFKPHTISELISGARPSTSKGLTLPHLRTRLGATSAARVATGGLPSATTGEAGADGDDNYDLLDAAGAAVTGDRQSGSPLTSSLGPQPRPFPFKNQQNPLLHVYPVALLRQMGVLHPQDDTPDVDPVTKLPTQLSAQEAFRRMEERLAADSVANSNLHNDASATVVGSSDVEGDAMHGGFGETARAARGVRGSYLTSAVARPTFADRNPLSPPSNAPSETHGSLKEDAATERPSTTTATLTNTNTTTSSSSSNAEGWQQQQQQQQPQHRPHSYTATGADREHHVDDGRGSLPSGEETGMSVAAAAAAAVQKRSVEVVSILPSPPSGGRGLRGAVRDSMERDVTLRLVSDDDDDGSSSSNRSTTGTGAATRVEAASQAEVKSTRLKSSPPPSRSPSSSSSSSLPEDAKAEADEEEMEVSVFLTEGPAQARRRSPASAQRPRFATLLSTPTTAATTRHSMATTALPAGLSSRCATTLSATELEAKEEGEATTTAAEPPSRSRASISMPDVLLTSVFNVTPMAEAANVRWSAAQQARSPDNPPLVGNQNANHPSHGGTPRPQRRSRASYAHADGYATPNAAPLSPPASPPQKCARAQRELALLRTALQGVDPQVLKMREDQMMLSHAAGQLDRALRRPGGRTGAAPAHASSGSARHRTPAPGAADPPLCQSHTGSTHSQPKSGSPVGGGGGPAGRQGVGEYTARLLRVWRERSGDAAVEASAALAAHPPPRPNSSNGHGGDEDAYANLAEEELLSNGAASTGPRRSAAGSFLSKHSSNRELMLTSPGGGAAAATSNAASRKSRAYSRLPSNAMMAAAASRQATPGTGFGLDLFTLTIPSEPPQAKTRHGGRTHGLHTTALGAGGTSLELTTATSASSPVPLPSSSSSSSSPAAAVAASAASARSARMLPRLRMQQDLHPVRVTLPSTLQKDEGERMWLRRFEASMNEKGSRR